MRWAIGGCLTALGAYVFAVYGDSRTEQGTASYLGLEEGDWRVLQNPALAVWFGAAWLAARRLPGRLARTGALLIAAGLAAVIAGNFLEFGLLGEPILGESRGDFASFDAGYVVYVIGTLLVAAGLPAVLSAWLARSVRRGRFV